MTSTQIDRSELEDRLDAREAGRPSQGQVPGRAPYGLYTDAGGGVPLSVVATILGWSPATTALMAKRYGHIGDAARRSAVAVLDRSGLESGETGPELGTISLTSKRPTPQVIEKNGAPCRTRTCGLLVRSQTLYPAELRAHI